MFSGDFLNLSLSVQVSLASGYLSYVTAYAGFRKEHSGQDAAFITLAFASIAQLTFILADPYCGSIGACASALSASLLAAVLWRRCGKKCWQWVMAKTNTHRDDGVHAGWLVVTQTPKIVEQVSVHMKNGRVLYLNDRRQYNDAPWQGVYFGGDGSVAMVVDEEELPDGTTEAREGMVDPDWGTRMTYIPASEIARINIRMK